MKKIQLLCWNIGGRTARGIRAIIQDIDCAIGDGNWSFQCLQEAVGENREYVTPLAGGHLLFAGPATAVTGGRRGCCIVVHKDAVHAVTDRVLKNRHVLLALQGGIVGSLHLPCDTGSQDESAARYAAAIDELSRDIEALGQRAYGSSPGQVGVKGKAKFVILCGDVNLEFSGACEPYVGEVVDDAITGCPLREAALVQLLRSIEATALGAHSQAAYGDTLIGWRGEKRKCVDHVFVPLNVTDATARLHLEASDTLKSDHLPIYASFNVPCIVQDKLQRHLQYVNGKLEISRLRAVRPALQPLAVGPGEGGSEAPGPCPSESREALLRSLRCLRGWRPPDHTVEAEELQAFRAAVSNNAGSLTSADAIVNCKIDDLTTSIAHSASDILVPRRSRPCEHDSLDLGFRQPAWVSKHLRLLSDGERAELRDVILRGNDPRVAAEDRREARRRAFAIRRRARRRARNQQVTNMVSKGALRAVTGRAPAPSFLTNAKEEVVDRFSWSESFLEVSRDIHGVHSDECEQDNAKCKDFVKQLVRSDAFLLSPRLWFSDEHWGELLWCSRFGKAIGEDGLTAEILLFLPDEVRVTLYRMLEQLTNAADPYTIRPQVWRCARAVLLAKQTVPLVCRDFREITLHAASHKLFLRAVIKSISTKMPNLFQSPWLHTAGGIKGVSTGAAQLKLKCISAICAKWGLQVVTLKLDLSRAFARLSHYGACQWLLRRGVPPRELAAICADISDQQIRLGYLGECFGGVPLRRGVTEGGPASMWVLTTVISGILNEVLSDAASSGDLLQFPIEGWPGAGRIDATPRLWPIKGILWVDDMFVFLRSFPAARKFISKLEQALDQVNEVLNASKSAIASLNIPAPPDSLPCRQGAIARRQELAVLGSQVSFIEGTARDVSGRQPERNRKEVRCRCSAAWGAFRRSEEALLTPTVSLRDRFRALQAAVLPVLVFGLHTSALTREDIRIVSRCFGQMCGRLVRCERRENEEWYQWYTRKIRRGCELSVAMQCASPLQYIARAAVELAVDITSVGGCGAFGSTDWRAEILSILTWRSRMWELAWAKHRRNRPTRLKGGNYVGWDTMFVKAFGDDWVFELRRAAGDPATRERLQFYLIEALGGDPIAVSAEKSAVDRMLEDREGEPQ